MMENWQLTAQPVVKDCFFKSTYQAVRERKRSHLASIQEILTALFCRNVFLLFEQVFLLLSIFVFVCVLQGLTSRSTDTYETINLDKKHPVVWW